MKRLAVWLLVGALPVALILASCKGGSEQSNTFKIGVITSLTETDGLIELGEDVTEVAPGAMVGFLSYAALTG